ncbi:hypothetical protein HanPI659440_Chr15g0575651 [Helianthus annuus]|nr:hypothetical protein HanPI659440_Chr15g0575651 [Helianthus annuus]
MDSGIFPLNLLPIRSIVDKFFRFPIDSGIPPEKLVWLSTKLRSDPFTGKSGKEPLRFQLADKSRICKLCSWRTFSGNVPIKLQEPSFMTVKFLKFAKKSGTVALKLLRARFIIESDRNFSRESSKGPDS